MTDAIEIPTSLPDAVFPFRLDPCRASYRTPVTGSCSPDLRANPVAPRSVDSGATQLRFVRRSGLESIAVPGANCDLWTSRSRLFPWHGRSLMNRKVLHAHPACPRLIHPIDPAASRARVGAVG